MVASLLWPVQLDAHPECMDHLTLNDLTRDIVEGTYTSISGHHIHFVSSQDSLNISSSENTLLIQVPQSIGSYRLINIGSAMFIQKSTLSDVDNKSMEYTDYAVPLELKNKLSYSEFCNVLFFDKITKSLSHLSHSYHQVHLMQSFQWLSSLPDTKLIIEAAICIGKDMQVSGIEYPSILPLYLTAMKLHALMANPSYLSFPTGGSIDANSSFHLSDADDDCLADCPPCEDDLCLGMCGYSCSCWKWVCGDCCYHLGCYDHDVCCREKFMQIKCLFPIGFECEANYEC